MQAFAVQKGMLHCFLCTGVQWASCLSRKPGAAHRSNSTPQRHVVVYIGSNVRQFHTAESIIQLSFRAELFIVWPCVVGHNPGGGGSLDSGPVPTCPA